MVGGGFTVKLLALPAVPPGVVTVIFPLPAPAGTLAVMVVALTTEKVAATPLKCTDKVVARFVPVSVTVVPAAPLLGVMEVSVGGNSTVKFVVLVAVPLDIVTVSGPLLAPAGTLAVIVVLFTQIKIAAVPLNFTEDGELKLAPVMVTTV